MRLLMLLLGSFIPLFLCAQNYIEAGYTPSRTFLDKDRNNCGSGDLWQIKGMYSHTFSTKLNENGQPIVWAGTINGMYAKMNNKYVCQDEQQGVCGGIQSGTDTEPWF